MDPENQTRLFFACVIFILFVVWIFWNITNIAICRRNIKSLIECKGCEHYGFHIRNHRCESDCMGKCTNRDDL